MRCGGRGAARGVARWRRPRTGAAGARARGDDAAAHLAQLLRELDHEGGALLRRERGDVDGWCDVRLNRTAPTKAFVAGADETWSNKRTKNGWLIMARVIIAGQGERSSSIMNINRAIPTY